MTSPGTSRGQPPFERAAQDAIAATQPHARPVLPPELAAALTLEEKAEADKAEKTAQVCRFCIGFHPLPNSPGCPRLASFDLDGEGRVKSGAFFAGTKWAKGRVVFFEDTKESPDAPA